MANDNSRKIKQNQIMFCIQPWIVEFSRPLVFGEDRLRERGSLPVTFYVLTRVFPMANDNSRKIKQNQIMFCIQPWFVAVSYTHLQSCARDGCWRQKKNRSWCTGQKLGLTHSREKYRKRMAPVQRRGALQIFRYLNRLDRYLRRKPNFERNM